MGDKLSEPTGPNRQRLGLRFALGFFLTSALLVVVGAMMQSRTTYTLQQIDFPAAPNSGEPHLAEDLEGRVFASWIEKYDDGTSGLLFSRLNESADFWSPPSTIATGDNWFVNWADVPSIAVGPNGRMAAHWLERLGSGRYAYGVNLSVSNDNGATWSDPVWLHEDESSSEHGFVSMTYARDGSLDIVWLDGRNMAMGGDNMLIMSRRINPDLSFGDEIVIDEQTCECCPTSLARLPDGSLVSAFRNRSTEEIRNIHVRKSTDTGWEDEAYSTNDGWKIAACPVNGPVVQVAGATVALAWFTAPDDNPSVKVAFSSDGGRTFSEQTELHENRPVGRVGLTMLNDQQAVVTWIESGSGDKRDGDGEVADAGIKMRIVHTDGTLESTSVVASTAASRSSGYPRVATQGDTLVFLWTQVGDKKVGEENKVVSSVGVPSL